MPPSNCAAGNTKRLTKEGSTGDVFHHQTALTKDKNCLVYL